jgi:hypothetical protein
MTSSYYSIKCVYSEIHDFGARRQKGEKEQEWQIKNSAFSALKTFLPFF